MSTMAKKNAPSARKRIVNILVHLLLALLAFDLYLIIRKRRL